MQAATTAEPSVPGRDRAAHELLDLLAQAARVGATAIHIEAGKHTGLLRVRCGGAMHCAEEWPAAYAHSLMRAASELSDAADEGYRPDEYQYAVLRGGNLPGTVRHVELQFSPLAGLRRYLVAVLRYLPREDKM